MRLTLDQIAAAHHADKACSGHDHPHGYTTAYERFFEPLRDHSIHILEIGVGSGESMMTWLEYFPKAHVYGVDIVADTNEWNSTTITPHERYTFEQGNQGNHNFWKDFVIEHGPGWDIVIDDGSHMARDVMTSFPCLWPYLKSGGLYCVEDLFVSYDPTYSSPNFPSHMEWIFGTMNEINRKQSEVESISFSCELVIMRKK